MHTSVGPLMISLSMVVFATVWEFAFELTSLLVLMVVLVGFSSFVCDSSLSVLETC